MLSRGSAEQALGPALGAGPAAPLDPSPTPAPSIPTALRERLDGLPEKLRQETLQAFQAGSLGLEQVEFIVTQYENRNPSVRVGSVVGVYGGVLRFEVFTTGEQVEVITGNQTLVRRGDQDIPLEDLREGELVMVVSAEGGALALTIEALGVSAP